MVLNLKIIDSDNIRKNYFITSVVKHREMVEAPSLETFKVKLDEL